MSPGYIDFQDRSAPLAFFITIRCYGTWLHGDNRYSMDRKDFNEYGAPKLPRLVSLEGSDRRYMSSPAVNLDAERRWVVSSAIREFCIFRNSHLHALNVRTNHAHMVIAATTSAERLMGGVKSYATRALRKRNLVAEKAKVWSRHGSTKYLWTEVAHLLRVRLCE